VDLVGPYDTCGMASCTFVLFCWGGGGGVASVMSFELARKSDPHVIMLGGFL